MRTNREKAPKPSVVSIPKDYEFGTRNNYFDGKNRSVGSLRVEQNYQIYKQRLVNRSLHGFGVVSGFDFRVLENSQLDCLSLKIKSGMALDPVGRELLFQGGMVYCKDVIWLKDYGVKNPICTENSNSDDREENDSKTYLLQLHYAEKLEGPVSIDSHDWHHYEWDRTRETVRFSVCQVPDSAIDSVTKECEGGLANEVNKTNQDIESYICNLLTSGSIELTTDRLVEIGNQCETVRVDLENGVPLGFIKQDGSQENSTEVCQWDVFPCPPRNFIKNNELLYALIKSQSPPTTHISQIGWEKWHRKKSIPIQEFLEELMKTDSSSVFNISFSGGLKKDTVLEDCFAIRIITSEPFGGQVYRVPITSLKFDDQEATTDLVSIVRLVFDGSWVENTVHQKLTDFKKDLIVEIEVRGDFMIDCNGFALDANARGDQSKSGNGVPGGTFLSTFVVKQ